MTIEQRIDDSGDRFPVGMRVLAVDDDPACLKLLDALLRKCQYHVTTTNQAITALKLLRENKNNFDLVISDVHMPDMDGFKLLELVGLEMDLPVIMLSANDDTRLVMKGITHGACDYLVKPIRIEELKNIWQHVIRRKKFDSKPHHENGGEREGLSGTGDSDHNGKLNRKRKDQNEDGDEENDENGNNNNNDDTSTQKKPRVVWSSELHRKFVAAVNQLGVDRAVPKRILDMMNVEKLTRENVASHLQKYRAYLKRISSVENQQATMAAVLRGTDYAFPQLGYLNGIGNNCNMARTAQFQNSTSRPFSHTGMLGRLNSPAGLVTRGLSSSGLVQVGPVQNPSNPIDDPSNFHPIMAPGRQNGTVLHGLPLSQDLDQGPDSDGFTLIRELSTNRDNSMDFPVNSGFSDMKIGIGDSGNSLLGVTNNAIVLEGHHEEFDKRGVFINQSSMTMVPLNAEFPSHLEDYGRSDENWRGAVQSSDVLGNAFTLSDGNSLMVTHVGRNPHDLNLITSGLGQMLDSRMDLRSQVASVGDNVGQNMSYIPNQGWDDRIDEVSYRSDLMPEPVNSFMYSHGVAGPFNQESHRNTAMGRGDNNDFNLIEQSNFDAIQIQHNDIDHSPMDTSSMLKQRYLMEQREAQGSYEYSKVHSLDDLWSAVMKQEQEKLMSKKEGGFRRDS